MSLLAMCVTKLPLSVLTFHYRFMVERLTYGVVFCSYMHYIEEPGFGKLEAAQVCIVSCGVHK